MTIQQIKSTAQARGLYDSPLYIEGEEKPPFYVFFDWKFLATGSFSESLEYRNYFSGQLKEELFDSLEKKIAYLQGVFEDLSEGYGVINRKNYICFANSQHKVNRCKKWLNEIAHSMFFTQFAGSFTLLDDSSSLHKDKISLIDGAIVEHNILYCVPICHTVKIKPIIVEYIQNYKFSELC